MKLDTDSEVIARLSPMETRQTGMEGDGGRGTENIARAVGVYDAMRTDPLVACLSASSKTAAR